MPDTIRDGTGTQYEAKVDTSNRLHTRSVETDTAVQAAVDGRAYNINTKKLALTDGVSGLLYFFNSEDSDFIVESIALGVSSATLSDIGELLFIADPTGGTLISDATAVDIKVNRNAGSGNTLKTTTLVYKGGDGKTVTGGTDAALFFQGSNGRFFATFPYIVPKGHSVAMTYDPNGSVNVYAALIGYLKEDA